MKMSIGFVLCAALVVQQPAGPESAARTTASAAMAAAADPADCVKALRTFLSRRQQEVRPPSGFTSELIKQVEDEKTALGQSCVTRFAASSAGASL